MEETKKPRVRRIGEYRYVIESRSQPGIGRQVDTLRLACSCPAGRNKRRCWHLVAALQMEDWRKRQHEQAKAASWGSAPAAATAPVVPFHQSAGYAALADAFGA